MKYVKFLILINFMSFYAINAYAQTGPNDDPDGDMVVNSADVDDDNDGILDTEECDVSALDATLNAIGPSTGEYYEDGRYGIGVLQSDGKVSIWRQGWEQMTDRFPGIQMEAVWNIESIVFGRDAAGNVYQGSTRENNVYPANSSQISPNLKDMIAVTGDHNRGLALMEDGTVTRLTSVQPYGGSYGGWYQYDSPVAGTADYVAVYGGGLAGAMYGVKSDGTAWVFPVSGSAPTAAPQLDGMLKMSDNGTSYALMSDGTVKWWSSTDTSPASASTVNPPSGETFVDLGGGMLTAYLITDAGNAYSLSGGTLTQINGLSGIERVSASAGTDQNNDAVVFIDLDGNAAYYGEMGETTISLPSGYSVLGVRTFIGAAIMALESSSGNQELWGGDVTGPNNGTDGAELSGPISSPQLLSNSPGTVTTQQIYGNRYSNYVSSGIAPGDLNSCDSDGDGVPDIIDLDSDNDGVNDVNESGGTDADGDGFADGTPDGNGAPVPAGNSVGTSQTNNGTLITGSDSDGDGILGTADGAPNTYMDCDINNPNSDCDKDNVLNGVDCDPDNAAIAYSPGDACDTGAGPGSGAIDSNCNCVGSCKASSTSPIFKF